MISTVCISTGQQPVNLIPTLQLNAEKMYLISSQEAEKKKWTPNLKMVCQRKNLKTEVISITPETEMSPEDMAQKIISIIPADDVVYWNISGGKKSMTLGLIHAYQKRATPDDLIIYTDNQPHQIVQYKGFEFHNKIPMNYFLELEDILNLYGFTSGNTGTRLGSVIFPQWVSCFSENYKSNPLFQEMIGCIFCPKSEDARNKESLLDAVRRILNQHQPQFNNLILSLPSFDRDAKDNIRKIVRAYCNSTKGNRSIAPILTACNEFYWNKIKDAIIPAIVDELKEPSQVLLRSSMAADDEQKFLNILTQCGINIQFKDPTKKFLQSNVVLPERPGTLFEKLVSFEFHKVLTEHHLTQFIPHTYLGVKTFRLEYDAENTAHVPEGIQNHRNDDEFDLTMVMSWGALQIFEAKTYYGEGGDVLKSLRDSAMVKSGVFGRAIFIDHLLEKRKRSNGTFPDFYPPSLIAKRNIIKAMGMRAWGFDEIEKELPKTLKNQ